MRRSLRFLGWLALFTLVFTIMPARADIMAGTGDPFIFNFDENGNGSYSTDGVHFTPSPGVVMPDPSPGHNNVLTYMLPSLVESGDVRIWEDAAKTILSDVIRFTDAAGDLNGAVNADRMIYYSDPGDSDLADEPGFFPTNLTPRDGGGIVEVGAEGGNGFTYAPGGAFPANNVYNGISDTPEPMSLVLLGTTMALLSRRLLRKSA
jgi:hypothetical protein